MRILKKWLSMITVAVMLTGIMLCGFAAGETYAPGSTFEAVFSVTENPNHAVAAVIQLEYDHSVLTLISGSAFQTDRRYIFGDLNDIAIGTSFSATFQISEAAASGPWPIRLNTEEAYDFNEQGVSGLLFSDVSVTVGKPSAEEVTVHEADGFSYKIEDGNVRILKYLKSETETAVPETMEGHPVTAIDGRAFSDCPGLTSVRIPESVTFISTTAFAGCRKATVIVPAGSYAEQYCIKKGLQYTTGSELDNVAGSENKPDFTYEIVDGGVKIRKYAGTETEVSVPEIIEGYPVVSIAGRVFSDCPNLTSVSIPDSVTFINTTAFAGCHNVTLRVIAGSYAEKFCVGQGLNYTTESTVINAAVSSDAAYSYEIEDGVVRILKYLGTETEISVPENMDGHPVTQIGGRAFSDCPALTSVSIPDSITYISTTAFAGCRKVVLTVSSGSYAEQYCLKKGLPYSTR